MLLSVSVWIHHVNFRGKLIFSAGIVPVCGGCDSAGDVDVGDVIVLPDTDDPVLVTRVRLGQGGLIFTVTSAGGGSAEEEDEDRPVRVTAKVGLRKRGRGLVR
jgi:hypothetical protein